VAWGAGGAGGNRGGEGKAGGGYRTRVCAVNGTVEVSAGRKPDAGIVEGEGVVREGFRGWMMGWVCDGVVGGFESLSFSNCFCWVERVCCVIRVGT